MSERLELCDWVNYGKLRDKLSKIEFKETAGHPTWHGHCIAGKQRVWYNTVRCTPLDKIKKHELGWVWNKNRLDAIRIWATPLNLSQTDIAVDNWDREIPHFRHLPNLVRKRHIDDVSDIEMYEINDGVHRIARAKELGMSCILSHNNEIFEVPREEITPKSFYDWEKQRGLR